VNPIADCELDSQPIAMSLRNALPSAVIDLQRQIDAADGEITGTGSHVRRRRH
jgi:hypothetical protein